MRASPLGRGPPAPAPATRAKNTLSRAWSWPARPATARARRDHLSPDHIAEGVRPRGAQSDNNDLTSAFQPLAVIQVSNPRLEDL